MSLGEYTYALKFRDMIRKLVTAELESQRPRYRYATVQSIDRPNYVCTVRFIGDTTDVPVLMGSIQPSAVGQRVRVAGIGSDRYIDDVMGTPYLLSYTKAEADSKFVDAAGDYMSGALTVVGSVTATDLVVGSKSAPRGFIQKLTTSAAAATTTTTEVRDTNIGTIAFTVVSGRYYRVRYIARTQSDAAPATVDYRIRNGGSSTPTNTSTAVAGSSVYLAASGGAGGTNLLCEAELLGGTDIPAGAATLAPFYVRTAGSGNVLVSQATGQLRTFSVEDLGT